MQQFYAEAPQYLVDVLSRSHLPHQIDALAEYHTACTATAGFLMALTHQPDTDPDQAFRMASTLSLAQHHSWEHYLKLMRGRTAANDDGGR